MPYHWYNRMSDHDAAAVAWYLKRVEPVQNEVESRRNLVFGIGKLLFIHPERTRRIAETPRAATPGYGEYLALHVAVCVDCHTPRGGLMSEPRMSRMFAGTADPPSGFPANPSNITPDSATGIGAWTEAQFLHLMRTGINPAGREVHPFMPWHQYQRMTDDDLRAIYRYLRTVRPIRNVVPVRSR